MDGGTYRLQISYVYYNLESKVTSNFDVTSKKLGRFEKKMYRCHHPANSIIPVSYTSTYII